MQHIKAQRDFILMALLVVMFMFSLWLLTRVWLILFASVLMAVFILSLVQGLKSIPGIGMLLKKAPHALNVMLVVLLLLGVLFVFGSLFGQELLGQLEEMKAALPKALAKVQDYVMQLPFVDDWLDEIIGNESMDGMIKSMLSSLPSVLGNIFSAFTTFLIVMLLGVFLALSPRVYVDSLITLIPMQARDRAAYLFKRTYAALQQWLVGQFVVMTFVGVCTTVALWLMDIPFALAMGFISFLLDFVPVLGPWLAAVPIILITMLIAPDMVLWVTLMMVIVQQLESYVVAPLVQQKLVNLPPVALLVSQVIMGSLTGFFGVAMATPLIVTMIVWTQVLYIKFMLGDYGVRVLGQDKDAMRHDRFAYADGVGEMDGSDDKDGDNVKHHDNKKRHDHKKHHDDEEDMKIIDRVMDEHLDSGRASINSADKNTGDKNSTDAK